MTPASIPSFGPLFAKSLASVSMLLLAACAPNTPQWDSQFGESVRLAAAQQTLNPEASSNPDPVKGIDGRAAREAIGRYQSSFKEPPPAANSFTIGVGR